MMNILKQYVASANPEEVEARLNDWESAKRTFEELARDLDLAAKRVPEAFEETSYTAGAAQEAFRTSATKLTNKVQQLTAAIDALSQAQTTTRNAQKTHERLEQTLSFEPVSAPDASSTKYAQSGPGIDSAQAVQNQKALQADRDAYNAQQATIADAEAAAAKQIEIVDQQNYTSQPPVRALTEEPGTPNDSAPQPPSSPGSYSAIAASKARMAQYNSGTLYPEGWGHELIAQEKANIAAHEAENTPEWNGTRWINADGSPAPATSYAMVETADGLAPLAGGTGGSGGMAALAIGGGGALLGAGVAKALASRFAAGASAKAATPSATSRSATARAGAAGARAGGGTGAGARGAGAGARGAGAGAGARGAGGRGARGGPTGAGSRAGRGGVGGAGRGGKKDDKRNGQDQDWQADYTDDWTETASDVLDPGTARGWTPNAPQDDASGADKNGRKPS